MVYHIVKFWDSCAACHYLFNYIKMKRFTTNKMKTESQVQNEKQSHTFCCDIPIHVFSMTYMAKVVK